MDRAAPPIATEPPVMDSDLVVLLSRIQFAVTIGFHYLYPPLSIGLGLILVFMEGMFLRTGNVIYETMTRFWVRIFGLTFAMGVASGIVMEFQFGTNWSAYSRFVGDIFGAALAAEGIFAFFLESGFLAILLFGWDKVSPRMHFLSTVLVCLGAHFSAVWIIVANSWQQTPAGYHLVENAGAPRAELISFWEAVLNPSTLARLTHVLLGAYILAGFFVMSITAFYLLRGRHQRFARRALVIGLLVAAFASLAQLVVGDWSARVVARHQPLKLAAFDAIYKTEPRTPMFLFGFPDDERQTVRYGLRIPGLMSLLLHLDMETPVTGLDSRPRDEWPPVALSFQLYHVMIALGLFFVAVTLAGLFHLWRGTLFQQRWYLKLLVPAVVLPYIANQVGWGAAEVGRQPWIVYGLLRTRDAVSPAVKPYEVWVSLVLFTAIYLALFFVFLYVLDRKIRQGPEPLKPDDLAGGPHPPEDFLDAISRRGKMQFHATEEAQEGA